MLRFFISFSLLFCSLWALGQNKPIDLNPTDTVQHKQTYGLRLGVDVSKLIISQLNENYQGIEFVADFRLTNKYYLAAELGTEDSNKQEDLYNFSTSGSYLKIGVNKNNYANWYGERNLIFMGARIGFSTFNNTLNNYQYYTANRYWNPDGFTEGTVDPEKFTGRSATWLEGVFGTQVQVLPYIYMGASIRLGAIVTRGGDNTDRLRILQIPGFGKVTDDSRFGVGFNYSISYFLPLYKKNNKAPETAKENKESE